jgi:two-component system, NarL family, sensor histidine kinase UhpB
MRGTLEAAPHSSGDPGSPPGSSPGRWDRWADRGVLHRMIVRLLRIPLFHKVFLANLAIVAGAVLVTAWLTRALVDPSAIPVSTLTWGAFGIIVIVLLLGANAALVRIALSPLQELEHAARKVATNGLVQGAPISAVADRDLVRIIETFNTMLDQTARYRERLRELAAHALTAQESERARVAQELHDDAAQRMAAIALELRVMRDSIAEKPLADRLDRVRDSAMDAAEGLRRTARGLRPPMLDELGLVPAVQAHVRELRERSPVRIQVRGPRREPTLSDEAELAAYRIVQEALANVLRHAQASDVRVTFHTDEGGLHIVIADDGIGFTPPDGATVRKEEALGLLGMQERAAWVGGRTEIHTAPGKGTRVEIHLPSHSLPDTPSRESTPPRESTPSREE